MDGALDWKGTGSVIIYLYQRYQVVVDIPYAFPEKFTEAILTQYLEQVFVGKVVKCTFGRQSLGCTVGIS